LLWLVLVLARRPLEPRLLLLTRLLLGLELLGRLLLLWLLAHPLWLLWLLLELLAGRLLPELLSCR